MCKGLLNTLVQRLFCSLNLSFGGARRGLLQTPSNVVVVVVILLLLPTCNYRHFW